MKSSKQKIFCYTTSLAGGGAERQMANLCNFLAEKGFLVTLVTELDVPDFYKVSPAVRRVCFGYNVNANVLSKLLKKIYGFLYFLTLKTRCVISFQIGANARLLRALRFRKGINVIVSERNLVTWELSAEEKYVYSTLYNSARYIVPNSKSMEQYLKDHFPHLSNKLVTIINYTDINKYKASPLPLRDKLEIAVFARYQEQKNYRRFAESIKRVIESEHRAFHITWYGDKYAHEGQSGYKEFLQLVNEYCISDFITLEDFCHDVPAAMEKVDIIALPSIFEGFSNSLAEAISCGKPVVAGDVSDNSTMISENVNGYLFDPFDVNDMANKFLKIINSSNEELSQMARRSRDIAERLFNKELFVNEYIKLIES